MKSFLKQRIRETPGKILSPENEVVGSHPGAMFFTIGERVRDKKGLLIDKNYRKKHPGKLFVAAKTKKNEIVIAPESHRLLKTKNVFVKDFRLINEKDFPKSGLRARIRHLGKLIPGKILKKNGKPEFVFNTPQEGVAEGQFIVLYRGERVIGGGEIRFK